LSGSISEGVGTRAEVFGFSFVKGFYSLSVFVSFESYELAFVEFYFRIVLPVFFFRGEVTNAEDPTEFRKLFFKVLVETGSFFGSLSRGVYF
jgi:hypothetical protein